MSASICPGCGLSTELRGLPLDEKYHASGECRALYDELSAFTFSLRDKEFIHQLGVDAYAAQHCGPKMKPITITFALIGLFLTFERGYTGREAQLAHIELGKKRRAWPWFAPPAEKGELTLLDVVPGLSDRNYKARLGAWGDAVWQSWSREHGAISALAAKYLSV